MTTSNTFAFSVSTNDLVREAMLNIGKLDSYESINPVDFADSVRKLNMIIKQLQGKADFSKGLKMWTRRIGYLFLSGTGYQYNLSATGDNWTNSFVKTTVTFNAYTGSLSLVVGSATGIALTNYIGIQLSNGSLFWSTVSGVTGLTITLNTPLPSNVSATGIVYVYAAKAQFPLAIEIMSLRDSTSTDVPVRSLNLYDYTALPSKTDVTNKSDPTGVYVEHQLNYVNLFTDCGSTSDVTKYLVINYQETIQDISGNPAETIEYPQEYYRAISWMLSKEICPMFNGTWDQTREGLLTQAVAVATNKDPETSSQDWFFKSAE